MRFTHFLGQYLLYIFVAYIFACGNSICTNDLQEGNSHHNKYRYRNKN